MSPTTVDLILGVALFLFAFKGFATGLIKSVVSLAAVLIAWFLSSSMSHVVAPALTWVLPPEAPGLPLVARIVTWIGAFLVVQLVGSMIAKSVNDSVLGGLDKLGGLILGAATGVLVGCLPLFVIFAVPAIYHWQPVQHVLKESFFLKTYAPLAAQVVPPPKKR
jgi:membrane protein required for colicin V production